MTLATLPDALYEATSFLYSFTMAQDVATLDSLTLTLYDADSATVVNARLNQDVLNTNGGTVVTAPGPPLVTTVTFALTPADTVILVEGRLVEYRVLAFRWTWDGGQQADAHLIQVAIDNMLFVP